MIACVGVHLLNMCNQKDGKLWSTLLLVPEVESADALLGNVVSRGNQHPQLRVTTSFVGVQVNGFSEGWFFVRWLETVSWVTGGKWISVRESFTKGRVPLAPEKEGFLCSSAIYPLWRCSLDFLGWPQSGLKSIEYILLLFYILQNYIQLKLVLNTVFGNTER